MPAGSSRVDAARPPLASRPLHGARCRGGRAACARSNSTAIASWCAAPCAACAMAINIRVGDFLGVALRIGRRWRADAASCSSIAIRRCRFRCSIAPTTTTSIAEWQAWGACSDCRCWSATRRRAAAIVPRLGASRRRARAAPPPPQRDQGAPAVDPAAPQAGRHIGAMARASRRARDHRAELSVRSRTPSRISASRRAAARRTGSVRRRGST